MNLNKLRDRAYKTACEHGFHDEELSNEHCLCLVISELMEAVEADRKGKYFKGILTFEREFNRYSALVEEEKRFKCSFERHVKDTVPYDIPTENTSFAVFILHLIFHNNTSSPFCLLTCISKL